MKNNKGHFGSPEVIIILMKTFNKYKAEENPEEQENKGISNVIPKQEYPAADDASPAAVGKLFTEQM